MSPDPARAEIGRVVALGASNLTRGMHTVVSTAREEWGPEVEVLAALGHGRSYGAPSRVVCRTLPGILQSGLWSALGTRPPLATRGLVTDVGNDIMYGASAEQTLAWVDEALGRLRRLTADIVVTDLPLASIRRLTNRRFLAFRSILFPSCRLSLSHLLDTGERVNEGLEELALAHGATFFRLKPEWYGIDPIHIRPSLWRRAWQEILGVESRMHGAGASTLEGWRLYLMPPERRWIFGVEQFRPQSGRALRAGARVWLY